MNQFVKSFLALAVFGACIRSGFADDANANSILDSLPPNLPIELVQPGQEAYAAACWAVATSSGFDPLAIDRFDEFMDDETVVQVPLSGIYVGPKDIAEYIGFITAANPFLDYFTDVESEILPLSFTEDGCEVFIATKNKSQLTAKYTNGEKLCMEFMVGFYVSFTVDVVKHFNPFTDDSGLLVKRINGGFPDNFPFFTHFGGDNVTDYVCNDVLRDSCPDVYEANGLNEESCKATFEALPVASENNNFVDDNSRGCRILHSVFAETNEQHCPHISFLPMEDEKGKIKCQVTDGVSNEDLFTPKELEFYRTTGINFGFSPDEFWSYCDYVDPEPAVEEPDAEEPDDSAAAATGTSVSFLLLTMFLFACCVIS